MDMRRPATRFPTWLHHCERDPLLRALVSRLQSDLFYHAVISVEEWLDVSNAKGYGSSKGLTQLWILDTVNGKASVLLQG